MILGARNSWILGLDGSRDGRIAKKKAFALATPTVVVRAYLHRTVEVDLTHLIKR